MEKEHITRLVRKLQDKSLSEDELKRLQDYLRREGVEDLLFDDTPPEPEQLMYAHNVDTLYQRIQDDARIALLFQARRTSLAASVLAVCDRVLRHENSRT